MKKIVVVILWLFCAMCSAAEVTSGLVQKYDGRNPGTIPHQRWKSSDGFGQDGVLESVGNGSLIPLYIPNVNGGGYEFSFSIDSANNEDDTGGAIVLGNSFIPDYDNDYTVEIWFRPDGVVAEK